jgi:hypothetical protein
MQRGGKPGKECTPTLYCPATAACEPRRPPAALRRNRRWVSTPSRTPPPCRPLAPAGHMARDCPEGGGSRGPPGACYTVRQRAWGGVDRGKAGPELSPPDAAALRPLGACASTQRPRQSGIAGGERRCVPASRPSARPAHPPHAPARPARSAARQATALPSAPTAPSEHAAKHKVPRPACAGAGTAAAISRHRVLLPPGRRCARRLRQRRRQRRQWRQPAAALAAPGQRATPTPSKSHD